MPRSMSLLALVLSGSATVIMFLPTWASRWSGGPDGEGLTYHRWFATQWGFGDVVPMVCLVTAVAMLVAVIIGIVQNAVNWFSVLTGLLISLLLVVFGHDQSRASFVVGLGQWIAPLVATASLILLGLRIQRRRHSSAAAKSDVPAQTRTAFP